MTDQVRIGSVGLGWWGSELAGGAERSGQGRIVSCFARSEDARQEFADRHGCRMAPSLDDLLADDEVEAVVIATPHSTHRDFIVAAAEAGKHILVEKPLTLTVEDGRHAVDAAAAAGVVLQVGHHRRRFPATRAVKALAADGALGQIHLLEASYNLPTSLKPKPGWRENAEERPLGGMTPLGVHMLDNFRYVAGPFASVSAFTNRLLGNSNLDDVTTVIVEFASGALGSLGTSLVVPKVIEFAAYGTGGIAWSEQDGTELFVQPAGEERRVQRAVEPVDALAEQFAAFAAAIRSGAPVEVSGASALEVVAVLEAAIRSSRERRVVELTEVGWTPDLSA